MSRGTGERIGECKTVPDVMSAVSDFYQKAFEEYSKEMAELSEMGVKAASETMKEAEQVTKKVS